ncbi:GlxA family transcriptional regulator [Dyadobacter sandarakinus]|uniref:Helix-turn-helix domain-containing protein n=1 Tax=Dyadobacter sandarakinus TaxID=2747268 RepID=A0ABX7I314_9BACT|nr:helix-turn-helix domain-containing protein [Dyadobacter sandarakinus]QRR00482.1 helix-turn-helix domain-containing protein [Dyadobacter sandarakinus]
MKHISVLVPKGDAALGTIEGPFKFFTFVNDFLVAMGREPGFQVELVGLDRDVQRYGKVFAVIPDMSIEHVHQTDLVIIPAVNGNREQVIEMNQAFFPWITRQHQAGAEVASLCVGAFLLAATGLLNGKSCTTHWMSAGDFRRMFPLVNLMDDRIITDERGVYTSGGANSFWNLLVYLVEKYVDREMAIYTTKFFMIDIDRHSQSPFIMFSGQKGHEDEVVRKAQEFIEKQFHERITVDQLSDMFAVGRRSFERRFKKATANSITEYIQRVKIKAAKKSFEVSRKNVTELMYEVGYTDTKAFRSTFKKLTGLSPVEYRNRYNKNLTQA